MDKRVLGIVAVVIVLLLGAGFIHWNRQQHQRTVLNTLVQNSQKWDQETPVVPPPTPTETALITALNGTADVLRDGTSSTARIGMELKEGDTVTVDASSTVDITFPEYGRMTVDAETQFDIRRLEGDQEHDSLIVNLKLSAGRIWTRLQKLLETDDSFDVRASNVVATVRGTSFGVEVDGSQVDLQVMEHRIAVREVRDREPTEEERTNGIAAYLLEEATGLSSDLQEGNEMRIDLASGLSMEAMLQPRPMSAERLQDPFLQDGNMLMNPEELRGITIPTLTTGRFSIEEYMRWVMELAAKYPDGNIPPEVFYEYFRAHGMPINAEDADLYQDPEALQHYLMQMQSQMQVDTQVGTPIITTQ